MACESAIVDLDFRGVKLPVRGYRCPKCGEEILDGGTLGRAQELAKRLGLFGTTSTRSRRALKIGSSIGVTLDREHLAALGIRRGDDVEIGLVGDHLELRRASG